MGESINIRPAGVGDVEDIERIVTAAYEGYVDRIGRAPAPMTVDYAALVATTDDVAVAVVADTVVGVLVTEARGDHLWIDNVAVAPGSQGRGIGRELLSRADTRARALGFAETRLHTNAAMTENVSLYPRLGYVETGRRNQDGFDRVYFVKDLL
ncbi:GNAT family N-acetyltransferase [Gordonia soli]|nr:GNAT family N-acetyltransferase [Gordonia soli]